MSNTGGPTTWFSGKSAPEDQKGPSPILMIGGIFTLYSPLGALVLLGCYIAFNYYRVSYRVIAGTAALYVIPYLTYTFLISTPTKVVVAYNAPWKRLIKAIQDDAAGTFLADNWWFWIAHQIWLSVALGLTFGAVWTWWKWLRRPAWEDDDRAPGPIHRLRRRRAINDISADLNGPVDGATVGVDQYGTRIVQTEREAAAHTLLAGGSGSGKTTTMMVGIRDQIRRGEPVLVVDMKGAADLPVQLADWSQRYGRRFLHWSITDRRLGYTGPADGPAFYDPIGRGDPSRKKDLLIGSEKWDVEYYKSVNENYLQTAFQIAELVPNPQVDAFTDLAALLDTDRLKQRAAALFVHAPKTPEGQQHAAAMGMGSRWWEQYPTVLDPYVASTLGAAADMLMKPEESERSAVRNLAARVQKLRQSTAGAWLKRDPDHGRDIDLRTVADEGWVVVFSLDSSNYKATSQQVGGLIIQDLNTLSSELRSNPAPNPFHIYVDEFSAIGQDNILDLLARARDARMPTMLSTQALADLTKADASFLDQALGIVNCFIIHRTNAEADAEIVAGLTGKKKVYKRRYGVEMTSGMPGGIGTGSATGQGHIEVVEDYVVLPSEFQELKQGELVYIAKSPQARVVHPVTVIRESEEKVAQAVATAPPPLVVRRDPSPFTEVTTASSEAFPSPWPVVSGQTERAPISANEQHETPQPDSPAFVPVPFHEATKGFPESATASKSIDLSEFDEPSPSTPHDDGRAKSAKKVRTAPIIDPAAYRQDVPPSPVPSAHTGAAPELTSSPVPNMPSFETEDRSATQPRTPPLPSYLTPETSQAVPPFASAKTPSRVDPRSTDEASNQDSVFGGEGNIEWEEVAPSWDPVDLGQPARRLPSRPAVSLAAATQPVVPDSDVNTPTTTENPKHPVMLESEWNE